MSSHVLSRLPRFDTALDADTLSRIGVQGTPPPAVPEAAAPAEADSQPTEPDTDPGPDLTQLNAMVAALSTAVQQVEAQGREQVRTVLQSMAQQLLPRVSEAFLAEEIARTLEDVVPVSVSALEIRAKPALAPALREAVARTEALAGRCTVAEQDTSDPPGVEVSWQTGGLTFDFDSLLTDSLARLDAA